MNENKTLVILDSGAGGLSVLLDIIKANSDLNYVYVADKKYFPYGAMTENALNARLTALVEASNQKFNPDAFVIACNTASTLSLPILRERFQKPFVGVVPAIKPAGEKTKAGIIGVLATAATVERPYIVDLINAFASHCRVFKIACPGLVELCENFILDGWIDNKDVDDELTKILQAAPAADTLVLACTHFPLLRTQLENALEKRGLVIDLVDSGEAIARRVAAILPHSAGPSGGNRIHIVNTAALMLSSYQNFLRANTIEPFDFTLESNFA